MMRAREPTFFVLFKDVAAGAAVAEPIGAVPDSFDVLTGRTTDDASLTFRVVRGGTPRDLVFGQLYFWLISERVQTLLRPFSGWKPRAAALQRRDGANIPGYALLTVTGRSGPIDPARSAQERVCLPGTLESSIEDVGWFIDPASWDGSDVFVPEGTAAIFVTERVRDALLRAKLTSTMVRPSAEIRSAHRPQGGGGG